MPLLNNLLIMLAISLMILGSIGVMKPGRIKLLTRKRSVALSIIGVFLVIIAPHV